MRPVRILCVCGSGTVSSAMLASKLEDGLEENGFKMEADEVAPGKVPLAAERGYDLIVFTSPVSDPCGLPTINATGFLVGMGEDEFIEELLGIIRSLDR